MTEFSFLSLPFLLEDLAIAKSIISEVQLSVSSFDSESSPKEDGSQAIECVAQKDSQLENQLTKCIKPFKQREAGYYLL